jgi:hypothetical protein
MACHCWLATYRNVRRLQVRIVKVVTFFLFHHRVSQKEAFEGPEPDDGKLSRPVLRGPTPRNGGRLLGSSCSEYGGSNICRHG